MLSLQKQFPLCFYDGKAIFHPGLKLLAVVADQSKVDMR
jgi:hypothetical protein